MFTFINYADSSYIKVDYNRRFRGLGHLLCE